MTFQGPHPHARNVKILLGQTLKKKMVHGVTGKENGWKGSENVGRRCNFKSLPVAEGPLGPQARPLTSLSSGSLWKEK